MSLPNIVRTATKPARIPAWDMAAAIAILFFGVAGFANATGHWDSAIPTAVYERLAPNADQSAHPMPGG
jgi:hypothetical protein